MSQKAKSFIGRLIRGFFGGGLAAMAVQVGSATVITTWQDFKMFQISLLIGFFTGGLLALEKMASWKTYQE
jgi:hypothetical protein